MTKPTWCRSDYTLGEDVGYPCQLPFGHEGDHRYEADEAVDWQQDTAHIVLTWKPNPKYRPPKPVKPLRLTPERAKALGLEGATIFS